MKLLKTKEAAAELGVSKATLESWRCHGGGPAYVKFGNKAVRYTHEDLSKFVSRSRRSSTSNMDED